MFSVNRDVNVFTSSGSDSSMGLSAALRLIAVSGCLLLLCGSSWGNNATVPLVIWHGMGETHPHFIK